MTKFKESCFDRLQDYAQEGFKGELSEYEQNYYNALLAQLGVYRKYGRMKAIHFLMVKPFSCSRRTATRMFDEAVNLFYADDGVTRQAWRNLMFEEVRNAALSILKTEGLTTDDLETYRRMMESAYKFKQLDQPDPEQHNGERQQPVINGDLPPFFARGFRAATFDLPFCEPVIKETGNSEKASDYIDVRIDDYDLCPRFCARVVKNVKIGPSPKWMRERLRGRDRAQLLLRPAAEGAA